MQSYCYIIIFSPISWCKKTDSSFRRVWKGSSAPKQDNVLMKMQNPGGVFFIAKQREWVWKWVFISHGAYQQASNFNPN